MQHILLILPLMILSFFSCGQDDTPVNNDKIKSKLGGSMMTAIMAPESVEVFLLNGWSKDSTQTGFSGYEVVDQQKMTIDNYQFLADSLATDSSYVFSKESKHCYFVPNIGLKVKKDGKEHELLFSLNCQIMRHYKSNTKIDVDIDPVGKTLQKFFQVTFFAQDIIAASINNLSTPIEPEPDSETNDDDDTPEEPSVEEIIERHTDTSSQKKESPIEYKIKEGDTLSSIARKHGISLDDLWKINQLTSTLIKVGEVLRIVKK